MPGAKSDPRSPTSDPRLGRLLQAGRIRVALFLPQYEKDVATGALRGIGTGFVALELIGELADRLKVAVDVVELPTPGIAVASLKTGAADVAFLGIEASRAAEVDFSPPLFQFDYTFLVPAGSPIQTIAGADRPGIKIAIVPGHASSTALKHIVRRAELVGAEIPDAAFELLRTGAADAFALPRENLLDYAARLPSSRVLDDSYGINRVGIAVKKGDAAMLAYIGEFVAEVKASGFIARAIARGGLRGFAVSPAADPAS